MSARVALGVGVDADQSEAAGLDAGLLHKLAAAGVLDRLAHVDEAAGERVAAFERRVAAANEKHAALGVEHDAVGGEEGRLRRWHGRKRSREGSEKLPGALYREARRFMP